MNASRLKEISTIVIFWTAVTSSLSAGIVENDPNPVFSNNTPYICNVEHFSSAYINDRAAWDLNPLFDTFYFFPQTITLDFKELEGKSAFLVILNGHETDEKENLGWQFILERWTTLVTDDISFLGTLGRGTIYASRIPAGFKNSVRMTWRDISGRVFYDAYLYCQRS